MLYLDYEVESWLICFGSLEFQIKFLFLESLGNMCGGLLKARSLVCNICFNVQSSSISIVAIESVFLRYWKINFFTSSDLN